ncbi:hypothetical protein C6N75_29070, partial [Streptomyces solincola]
RPRRRSPGATPADSGRDRLRRVIAASVGNAMEWFDWAAFVTFAALLGAQLQPAGDTAADVTTALSVFAVGFLCYAVAAPVATLEMFPTAVRSSGVGLPYALTVALFGGTAPFLHEYLAAHGHADCYRWYVAALCLLSTVSFLAYRETKDVDLTAVGRTAGTPARTAPPA